MNWHLKSIVSTAIWVAVPKQLTLWRILMRTKILEFKSLLACLAMLLSAAGTAFATFPGHNGLIAFQAQTSAGVQIYTVRPNGKDLQQITFLNGDAVAPAWSPNGRRIVFEHDAPGECANVAIMNADGNGLIEFPAPGVCEDDPSFTPDGIRIIFHRFDPATNDDAFWSMDLNGDNRQRIGLCCFDPNVSPNGKKSASFVAPTEARTHRRSSRPTLMVAIRSKLPPSISMSRLSRIGRQTVSTSFSVSMEMSPSRESQQTS